MPKILVWLLLPLLAIAVIAPLPAATTSTAKAASAQPALTVTDVQLDAKIRAKLAKSKIGKDGFRFHVQHGIVTWEGTTNIGQHKGAATRMARSSGAVQVINNIKVAGTANGSPMRKAYVQP